MYPLRQVLPGYNSSWEKGRKIPDGNYQEFLSYRLQFCPPVFRHLDVRRNRRFGVAKSLRVGISSCYENCFPIIASSVTKLRELTYTELGELFSRKVKRFLFCHPEHK